MQIKKDVRIIIKNEPLLFVQGPPVYNRVYIKMEESTSIYSSVEEIALYEETIHNGTEEPTIFEEPGIEHESQSLVRQKVDYLNQSFRMQVYQPLKFIMKDETLTGTLKKVEGDVIWIQPAEEEQAVYSFEIKDIEDIWWRGKSFELF